MNKNIHWHIHSVQRKGREELLNQKSFLIWFTGLSGSGKSTVAMALQKYLHNKDKLVYVLDGDNIRHGLNSNLGFSADDRVENIRRVGEVCKLFIDSGIITLSCFISPYEKDRNNIRDIIGKDFIEVYVDCDLDNCEKRDPKGLYKKARKKEILNFTGIDAPYEKPNNPEIHLNTVTMNVDDCVSKIIQYLNERNLL